MIWLEDSNKMLTKNGVTKQTGTKQISFFNNDVL